MSIQFTIQDSTVGGGGGTVLLAATPIEILPGGPTITFGENIEYARDSTGQLLVSVGARPTDYSLEGTAGRHGNTLNPVIQGRQGLDSRVLGRGAGAGNTLYDASFREGFPFASGLADGDVLFLVQSDDVSNSTLGIRQPKGWDYKVRCVATFPAAPDDSVAFEALKGPNVFRNPAMWEGIDFEARLNTLGSWPIPAGYRPDINDLKSRIARNWAMSAWTPVDTNPGGYEQTHAPGFTLNSNGADGYSQEFAKFMKQIIMVLGDPVNYSLADRAFILKWVTRQGVDYFFPRLNDIDNNGDNGGGHFSAQPIWAMWALWALGETTLLQNYGTPTKPVNDNSRQVWRVSAAEIARMVKHNNIFDPHPWRRRLCTAVVSATQARFEWDDPSGDVDWCNFVTLVCKNYNTDATIGSVTGPSPGTDGDSGSVLLNLTTTSGLVAGQPYYFDAPHGLTADVSPVWGITGNRLDSKWPAILTNETVRRQSMPETFGFSGYNPAPRARYRDYDQSEGTWVQGASAMMLGLLGGSEYFSPHADYAILNQRSNFPGSLFGNNSVDADYRDQWNRRTFNVNGTFLTTADWFAANGEAILQHHLGSSAGTTRWNSNFGIS